MILALASAFVSALITSGIAMLCVKLLIKPISSIALLNSLGNIDIGISPVNVIAVVISMIASAILFLPVFWGVRGLATLLLKLLTRGIMKLTERKKAKACESVTDASSDEDCLIPEIKKKRYDEFKLKKASWVGALCGALCAFLTMFIMAMPFVGLLGTAYDVAAPGLSHVELGESPAAKAVEILDVSVNNVGAKAVRVAGGQLLYDMMSYCKADENATAVTVKQDLSDAAELVGITAKHGTLTMFLSDRQKALANEQSTYEIIEVLINNPRLCHTVDMISDEVIKGFLFKVRVPQSKAPLYDEFLAEIAQVGGSDEKTVAGWYGEVFDDYGLRVSEEQKLAAARAKLGGADMKAWISDNIVADRSAFCSTTECMVVDDVTSGEPVIVDKAHEVKTLSHAISVVCSLSGDVNSSKFDIKKMMRQLGPVFDSYAQTETVGPLKTEYMLMSILQSRLVHDKIGLTVLGAADSARSIYENAQSIGYTGMMNSLSKAVEVVEAASSSKKDTAAAVKGMLEDLTPESSRVLQTMATPSVVRKYGVPERSAVPVSSMVSDTFKNLSEAKENGMSDEEYKKESAAVSNMMDILMSSDKKSTSATFGKNGVTGVTAEEYVNNIMDSKVMSDTVLDKVYVDGSTPTNDPLNSKRRLASSEKEELTAALTGRWNASDKSEETQKKLISLAAMLNVEVALNAEGAFEVVEPVATEQQN